MEGYLRESRQIILHIGKFCAIVEKLFAPYTYMYTRFYYTKMYLEESKQSIHKHISICHTHTCFHHTLYLKYILTSEFQANGPALWHSGLHCWLTYTGIPLEAVVWDFAVSLLIQLSDGALIRRPG